MSTIRKDLIHAALNRASALTDYNIYKDFHKQYEFMQQTILADNSLTEEEKIVAIRSSNKSYDKSKIFYNEGTRRVCENCNQKCLATLYCEYCVRNYLKYNFSNWTSGNYDIDNLIQKCQTETLMPSKIVEWIPYNNLQNIKYLTRGGFSEIYTAGWINGRYDEWDSNERKLIRVGAIEVILKQLENVESADQSWFEEARSYLTMSNKHSSIVQCFGLTQDPSNGTYMLVMKKMDIDLRNYLQQNHDQLTWKERIKITFSIIDALYDIHIENLIHRDLHFGNILYSRFNNSWRISDLGFCGPPDKPLDSIYGNLPYIAPEVIAGKRYTLASDIYSIAMLMWEISSGQPPFINYEHDSNLAINIIDGMRPKIISEIPSEYKSLMEQCWDADPSKRPDTETVINKMNEIMSYYQNKPDELPQLKIKSNNVTKLFTSKIHIFKNLREPKNATEEEQEAFHSKFSIPHNIDDFGESSNQYMSIIGKSDGIFKVLDGGKKLYSMFNKSTKNDNKNDYNKKRYINEDDDERYDPNLCSEEQDS